MKKQQRSWIDEYHKGVRYGLEGKVLIDEESEYQRITVIESKRYGKALLLDGCWMTAEKQEKNYHECLVHPALCSANEIKNGLIIGGGDGGTARECLRYKDVENLDLVEIDQRVIEISQKFLKNIGKDAWHDPRLQIKVEDGIAWTRKSKKEAYNFIIVDGSDPKGPAAGLFNESFLKQCKRSLRKGGIFAIQSESPESFFNVHIDTVKTIRKVFNYADPLYGWVPMYPSGWWSWTFAATEAPYYFDPITSRANLIVENCSFWSPSWQKNAFKAIPSFLERALQK